MSDSDDDGPVDDDRRNNEFVSDFEAMLARRKEEQTKRRRRKDIDIINDNDELIAGLLNEMRNAAEVRCVILWLINKVMMF